MIIIRVLEDRLVRLNSLMRRNNVPVCMDFLVRMRQFNTRSYVYCITMPRRHSPRLDLGHSVTRVDPSYLA